MNKKTIRTRYAPSPTGFMHIGNLRTALFEYLVAKNQQGKFILRIEDTDQERYVEGAVELIYDTLKAVGLQHDEGPDIGGPYAPYVQSERKNVYLPEALKLIESGHAYYCFATEEELEEMRKNNAFGGYDRRYRNLSKEEVQKRLAEGQPYVIRQKMPLEGKTTFYDEVYGEIVVENKDLEDQILIKTDGFPTYNFANVVDDHDMGITHVVRGYEYLSSTPKYNLLYDAFGYEKPCYIHLPHILGQDGQKLSKRHGSTSFADLIKEGYLPEAIINYIALLGWAPADNQEIFSLKELEEIFSVKRISKSPAIFDYDKLAWFNAQYLQKMDAENFKNLLKDRLLAFLPTLSEEKINLICELLQPRLKKINDFEEALGFLKSYAHLDLSLFVHQKLKTNLENAHQSLLWLKPALEKEKLWDKESLHHCLHQLAAEHEVKNGLIMWPLRVALTAQAVSPGGAIEALLLLGKEESLKRLQQSIEILAKELTV